MNAWCGCHQCMITHTHFTRHPAPHCRDGTPELGDVELPCRSGCAPSESHLLLSLLKTTWPARWLFKASLQKRLRVMCFFLVISSLPRLSEVPWIRRGFGHHSTWCDAERSRSFSLQLYHPPLHVTELLWHGCGHSLEGPCIYHLCTTTLLNSAAWH